MARQSKQKVPKALNMPKDTGSDQITDPRFKNIQTDPRFRLPSRKNTHVQIDKRFARMLRDDGFSSKAKVDRYGRRLPENAGTRELHKYYRLGNNADEGLNDDGVVTQELKQATEGDEAISSTSSDETSSEDGTEASGEEEEVFGILDEQTADGMGVLTGEASRRIAVVNLDWDNIRATDLMVVFSSFVPSGGRILKISIYPSDFGRERMEREDLEGPPKDIFNLEKTDIGGEDNSSSEDGRPEDVDEQEEEEKIRRSLLREDKGEEFNSTKLRRYQLERLRYYFAVLVCSSARVAQALYDAVDGTEYLTTANFFDLRFIPDDVDFSADKARDECERIPDGYKPNEFITDALQHSKVRLTWDADDGTRKEVQKRAFGSSRADIDENDLKAYIGSDNSDDEWPEPIIVDATSIDQTQRNSNGPATSSAVPASSKKDTERQRMRALLGLDSNPALKAVTEKSTDGPVGDVQITFSSGLFSGNDGSVFENEPERDETTVEKYVRKEKERRNRRKEKLKSSRNSGNSKVAVNEDADKTTLTEPVATDLGFSDPFFTAPSTTHMSLKAQKRAERRAERTTASTDDVEQREKLELLVRDEDGGEVHHFDTTLLAKGEKLAAKKGIKKKRHRMSQRQKEALEAKAHDDFQIDTKDTRFSAVFEKSEYAIDPNHKGFKDTEGMNALLEAGRKRRRQRRQDIDPSIEEPAGIQKQKKAKRSMEGDGTRRLVEQVKKKAISN
ncbi:MAG: hypothetical protein Q9195_006392 [Heterodermia aff. obscurata]